MNMALILLLLIVVIVAAFFAKSQLKKNGKPQPQQKKSAGASYPQHADTVPTPLRAPEVAKKYAPGFGQMVRSLQILCVFLSIILGAIALEYFDEEVIILIIVGCVFLNIMIIVNYGLACLFFRVAVDKGYTSPTYLSVAFWLGAFGYLLITALPNTYANVPRAATPPVQFAPQPVQVAQIEPPVQPETPTPPAPHAAPQATRCSQCGASNVPLQDITVNIAGASRTRSICRVCASKYSR